MIAVRTPWGLNPQRICIEPLPDAVGETNNLLLGLVRISVHRIVFTMLHRVMHHVVDRAYCSSVDFLVGFFSATILIHL
jgi:hypothetical protein